MHIWWYPAALGGLVVIAGFVCTRVPRQSLDYLDYRNMPVHGFPRSVGGIRAMGVMFLAAGGALVVAGFLMLFGVIPSPI